MKLLKKLCCLCCIFTLCTTFLSNAVFADKALNIVFVGGVCTGKTSLRARAVGDPYNFLQCKHTRYTDVFNMNLRYDGDIDLKCYLYDTSGSEHVRGAIVKERLRYADIVVLCVDASCPDYMKVVNENFADWALLVSRARPGVPIMFVATKIDDVGPRTNWRQLASQLDATVRAPFKPFGGEASVAVSALDGTNLGNMKSTGDFGNNFWGKIRCIIRDKNMCASLQEDRGEKEFQNALDALRK